MLNRSHIENKIHKALNAYLIQHGFDAANPVQYYKINESVIDYVQFRIVIINSDFGVIYSLSRTYNNLEKYWIDLKTNLNHFQEAEIRTINVLRTRLDSSLEDTKGFPILKNGGIFLNSSEIDYEIEKLKNTFIYEYENLICPFLKRTEDIHWMDKILNSSPFDIDNIERFFSLQLIDVKRIIVARLANNSNYEIIYKGIIELCNKFIAETNDEDTKKELEVIKIIYERLKNVSPLENPSLV